MHIIHYLLNSTSYLYSLSVLRRRKYCRNTRCNKCNKCNKCNNCNNSAPRPPYQNRVHSLRPTVFTPSLTPYSIYARERGVATNDPPSVPDQVRKSIKNRGQEKNEGILKNTPILSRESLRDCNFLRTFATGNDTMRTHTPAHHAIVKIAQSNVHFIAITVGDLTCPTK